MSPTVPEKNSLDFLSDFYFDTKIPVAFTSPLALYREVRKRFSFPDFSSSKTWLQSKDTCTLHKPVRCNFPRNRVIATGIDDQWRAELVDISSLARFNKGYLIFTNWVQGPYQEIQAQGFSYSPSLRGLFGKPRACISWYSRSTHLVNSLLHDPF